MSSSRAVRIALQYGTLPPKGEPGGIVKFRKVQVREL